MKRKHALLALLAVFSMVLAACGPAAEPYVCEDAIGCVDIAPDEPIKIAYMQPLTGAAVVYGESLEGAITLAASERGNKLLGHDLELVGEDSQCSAEGGEAAALKVAADPTIVGVIGTTCSSAMTAAMATISEAGLTIISQANTSPKLTNPNETWMPGYFRTAHNDLFQGAVAARFAYEQLGLRSASAIHDGDPYTEGLAQAFLNSFEDLGGEILAFEAVNKGDTDMRPVLTTIAANPPDVLYFPIFEPEGNFIAAQSVEIPGLENTTLFGADGLTVSTFAPSTGEGALGMYLSGPYLTGAEAQEFLSRYQDMHGELPPGPFGEHGYDGFNILLAAIEKVAVVDDDGTLHIGRQALRDAVEETSGYEGLTGTLSCAPKALEPGVNYRGDCATGEALAIFQVDADWIATEDVYQMGVHPPVVWTP
ncbi:MAG: ABC transporter substrate-binding protein [Anaerolineales bacterium]|nr:ABC transporter substrate-binding protein [Anaerolineales bacterium]